MKIAVLTSSYPRFPGDGTAPFVMSISSQLVEQGHDVRVVAPYDPEVKRMDPKGVELHRFRYIWPEKLNIMGHARALRADVSLHPLAFFLLPFYMCAALIKMLIVTQHQNSDLIHVHWVLPNGLIAAFVADFYETFMPYYKQLFENSMWSQEARDYFKAMVINGESAAEYPLIP